MRRSALLLVTVALIGGFGSACARAENLGVAGHTYPIIEHDLIEVFKARAAAHVQDGTWGKAMEKQTQKMKDYAARPDGTHLPRAMEYSARFFDPTVVLDHDIMDGNGRLLMPKGKKVNPLDFHDFKRTLCFFDGDDPAQVEWAKSFCLDPVHAKAILTNGPILDLDKELGAQLYFDQHGVLVKHFGIRALPTVIRQSGKVFAVEEFEVGS